MSEWWGAVALGVPMAVASVGLLATVELEARAETSTPTVVLLRPSKPNDVTTEALARVKGELEAAGFEVDVLGLSGDDARRDIETAGRDREPVAAFAIFVSPADSGVSVAEIWVSDRVHQKTVIQRTTLHETDGSRGSAILAVRAVELLKANLATLWSTTAGLGTQAPAPPPPPVPVPPPAPHDAAPTPRPPFASGLGAGVGVGVMESFGAVEPTWAPDVMVSYGWSSGLSVRASLHGLGPDLTLSSASGTARIEEQLSLLEAVKTWAPRAALVPFVFAGAGAQHLRIAGSGVAPYTGTTSDEWSLLTTVGAGVSVPLLSWLSVLAEARGIAAWPPTVVRIAGAEVGRVGAPSLLVDGGLLGVLR